MQDGQSVWGDSWPQAVPLRHYDQSLRHCDQSLGHCYQSLRHCFQSWKSPLDPNSPSTTSPAEQVRVAFGRWVHRHTGAISEEVRETLLVRQSCYCGKRLSSQGFSGIWFIEEGQIKLLGPDGHSYGTMPIASFLQQADVWPDRKAA